MVYFLLSILFFVALLGYFKIAKNYNIIDRPNERSSHSTVTIRGGGIIFLLAGLVILVMYPYVFWLPILGVLIIGIVSFLDDLYSLPNKIRILFQMAATTLIFVYLSLFSTYSVWGIVLLYILAIGIINAYNFMDGINGITGLYSLVVLTGLQYVNTYQFEFVEQDAIWIPMLACAVFLFFNFRSNAACFAGDVGSVTISFWIIFLLFSLILKTGNWAYILFLAVYGVDTVLTIMHRLLLRQNIFRAHRLHFYQLLANEQKVPHLIVAFMYSTLQALIVCFIIVNGDWSQNLKVFLLTLLPLVAIYIGFKPKLMHSRIK